MMAKEKILTVIVCGGVIFTLAFMHHQGFSAVNVTAYEGFGKERMAHDYIEERFRSRRERVLKTCQTIDNEEDISCSLRECILYFWKYNASVCTMGKVGSGNWRSHAQTANDVSGHPMFDGRRRELFRKPWQQVIDYTKSLSRWITVRHPLTRLVSCYQDKFRNGSDFPERKRNVLQEFLLPALLSNNLVFKDQESDIWKEFLDKRKRAVEKLDPEDERVRLSVTFTEFLKHVANTYEEGRIDRHWKTYGRLCSPCFFDYEYIARTETQDQDLEYLFAKFGFPSDPYKAAKVKEDIGTKMKRDFRYYDNVPLELKMKIYNIYKADMEMFGYHLPEDFWKTK
ncbi:carbohydrate sulfotransferase 12 [Penaeus vannamei]|uniref:carbohydrate sulfotransferase 12 n=1 Tax=Penaeus vannamei TaxID=6689 RepID=UPI00387FAE49